MLLKILMGVWLTLVTAVVGVEGYIVLYGERATCSISCRCQDDDCTCKIFRTNQCECQHCECREARLREETLKPLTEAEFKQIQEKLREEIRNRKKSCCERAK